MLSDTVQYVVTAGVKGEDRRQSIKLGWMDGGEDTGLCSPEVNMDLFLSYVSKGYLG